jgi:polyisoprenoid-binding protein YceI
VLAPPMRAGDRYAIDPSHSTVTFRVHHFLGSASGQFRKFSGSITLDRQHPERSAVEVTIDVASIDTGIQKRDNHLRSAEFFDVARYPQIIFQSRSVKQTGAQAGDVAGELTMHGVTKPVMLHVKLVSPIGEGELPSRTRWEVSADPIDRQPFQLMFGSTAEAVSGIGHEVTAKMVIEGKRD